MEIHDLIAPLGITTLSLIIVTIILGLNMKRNYKLMKKLHIISATLTLLAGLTHGSIILFFH